MKHFEQEGYQGKQVDVYRNLNLAKRDKSVYVWSVRYKGKVIGHTKDINLVNCNFRVAESTRLKIVDKGHRAVCAFVRGTLSLSDIDVVGDKVHFNPFTDKQFHTNGKDITKASSVSFKDNGCFV